MLFVHLFDLDSMLPHASSVGFIGKKAYLLKDRMRICNICCMLFYDKGCLFTVYSDTLKMLLGQT